jgi:serine phosphatase RsbU (regulator of sigma subunit)
LTEVFRGEEEFGDERLLQAFMNCAAVRSDEVLDSLWTALDEFSDGQEQSDDMTAMVLLREA